VSSDWLPECRLPRQGHSLRMLMLMLMLSSLCNTTSGFYRPRTLHDSKDTPLCSSASMRTTARNKHDTRRNTLQMKICRQPSVSRKLTIYRHSEVSSVAAEMAASNMWQQQSILTKT